MSIYNEIKDFTALTEDEIKAIIEKAEAAPNNKIVCAGVWKGGDIMALLKTNPNKEIIAIDSFNGLATPINKDVTEETMTSGEFNIGGLNNFIDNFSQMELDIPKTYQMFIDDNSIKEVHEKEIGMLWLDLDHYTPTLECLKHLSKYLVDEAIIMTHDYGFERCPGIKTACDEFGGEWIHIAGGIFGMIWEK